MRLKDELYHALVEKHNTIETIYHSYVDADPQRHKKHRIKSWLFLLCLNIQFVLFGEAFFNSKLSIETEKPLLFPESEQQVKVDELVESLLKFDIVSFDIFDTLILRACEKPIDLFSILGNRLGIPNYLAIRVEAEKIARRNTNKPNHEVDIYDIYHWVNLMCGIDINRGVDFEIQAEKDLCFANPYMLQVINKLVEKKKNVIAVSNMYLPKNIMQKLLENCGYSCFNQNNIFISCDLLSSKNNGDLQKKVWNIIGKNKSVIHVGDNYDADFVASRMAGWKSVYYKNVNAQGKKYRVQKSDSIKLSIANGLINAKFHNGLCSYSSYYEVGYAYAGILTYDFCKWINEFCQNHKIDLILFSGRDMRVVYQAYNKFFKKFDNQYMLISRFSSLRFSFNVFSEYYIESHVKARANLGKLSIAEVLDELDICLLNKYLKDYKLSEEDIFTRDNFYNLKKCIYDHKKELVDFFEPERKAALLYYKSLIGNKKRIAVVDLGWQGTNALCLKSLLEEDDPNIRIKSLLMCAMGRNYVNELITAGSCYSFCFSPQKNVNYKNLFSYHDLGRFLCELSFSSTEKSLKCFTFLGNQKVMPVFLENEKRDINQINLIHQGILDFIKDLCNIGIKSNELKPSGYEALLPLAQLSKQKSFVLSLLKENEINPWIGNTTNRNASDISKNVR